MTGAVVAAVVACLAYAAAGPRLARLLPPPLAVRILVPASLAAAGSTVFVLGTVTFTGVGQLAVVARFGAWSPQRLHALSPIPAPVAVATGAVLVPLAAWSAVALGRRLRALLVTHRAYRDLPGGTALPFVVVDTDDIDAFTTPGLPGRVVITTGMLAALDPEGQRVVAAHEWSHQRHHHPLWTLAAELAAAVNPLLRPTATAIGEATERWADEEAAQLTDRRAVARTIARIALLRSERARVRQRPGIVAAATGGVVPRRVRALLAPAPRTRGRDLGVALALTLALLGTALAVERSGEALFEHAEPGAGARVQGAAPAAGPAAGYGSVTGHGASPVGAG